MSDFESSSPRRPRVEVPRDIENLATMAVEAALAVHRELGPGLLETAYEACLAHELVSRGLAVERQKVVPLEYRGLRIEAGFRADLVVNGRLLLELKAGEEIHPIHRAQVITYLKLLHLPLGLLLNFNSSLMKDGIERVLNIPRVRR